MRRRRTDTAPDFPTPDEVGRWVLDTVRHAYHIEYYLQRLQIGRSDLQRPHDIVGHGNKLEWPAIRGFAMQYRTGPEIFKTYVLPALDYHRQQFHHLAWNGFNPTASVDAMKLGAVDAVCSLIEPRDYQGGCHTWEEVNAISLQNPIHKVPWMLLLATEMERIPKPDILSVTLTNFPDALISPESRDILRERVYETAVMLHQDHGIQLAADRRQP
jgi:hypothetical protein